MIEVLVQVEAVHVSKWIRPRDSKESGWLYISCHFSMQLIFDLLHMTPSLCQPVMLFVKFFSLPYRPMIELHILALLKTKIVDFRCTQTFLFLVMLIMVTADTTHWVLADEACIVPGNLNVLFHLNLITILTIIISDIDEGKWRHRVFITWK